MSSLSGLRDAAPLGVGTAQQLLRAALIDPCPLAWACGLGHLERANLE